MLGSRVLGWSKSLAKPSSRDRSACSGDHQEKTSGPNCPPLRQYLVPKETLLLFRDLDVSEVPSCVSVLRPREGTDQRTLVVSPVAPELPLVLGTGRFQVSPPISRYRNRPVSP